MDTCRGLARGGYLIISQPELVPVQVLVPLADELEATVGKRPQPHRGISSFRAVLGGNGGGISANTSNPPSNVFHTLYLTWIPNKQKIRTRNEVSVFLNDTFL